MLNGLDLFSGIGGLATALGPWVRPLAYCENHRHAQAVLLSRMADGSIARGPIWDDIQTLTAFELGWPWIELDIIYGGFPCQDISAAGRGVGLGGERSGLYFQLHRIIDETRPTFVFLENVPAIRTRGLIELVRSLADIGYDCRWTRVSAAEVGAPHLRWRWFLLAHANGKRSQKRTGSDCSADQRSKRGCSSESRLDIARGRETMANPNRNPIRNESRGECGTSRTETSITRGGSENVADSDCERRKEGRSTSEIWQWRPHIIGGSVCYRTGWWTTEPDVGRMAHGIPLRVDRLRGLGNAVVPAQAREAFMRLMGIHHQTDLEKYGLEEG